MKVKELIEKLQQANPEDEIILSRDAEGNGFEFLQQVEECNYNDDNPRNLEVGLRKLTDELIQDGYSEEDTMPDGKPCVLLWP